MSLLRPKSLPFCGEGLENGKVPKGDLQVMGSWDQRKRRRRPHEKTACCSVYVFYSIESFLLAITVVWRLWGREMAR